MLFVRDIEPIPGGKAVARVSKLLTVLFGLFLMTSLATGQSARQSSEFKPGSEPTGFRGIKWGMDISTLKDMTFVMAIDKDTKRYKRDADVLRMGEVQLDYVHYEFWKGIFYLVDIGFEGAENWRNLRGRMFATFGQARKESEEGDQLSECYRWEGDKATVVIVYNPSRGGGVTISSNEIMDQRTKEVTE